MRIEKIALVVCVLGLGLEGKASAMGPNFIVIIADDFGSDKMPAPFGWDTTGSPSYRPTTTTLTNLGNAGLRFTNAWANPVCSPTRASLNTGNYAWKSNIGLPAGEGNTSWLDDVHTGSTAPFQLMANKLAVSYGYRTALFGKWHLGEAGSPWGDTDDPVWTGVANDEIGEQGDVSPPPIYRYDESNLGYGFFDGFIGGGVGSGTTWERVHVPDWITGGSMWALEDEEGYADQVEVDAAWDWINQVYDDGFPWLAVVALAAPHTTGTGDYDETDVTDDSDCSLSGGTYTAQAEIYKAFVECMDERIGDFLGDVGAIGGITHPALANTVIVFMGDNGTPEGVIETPYDGPTHAVGKGEVYQSGVRVPFIMADGNKYAGGSKTVITGPGASGLTVTSLVQTWDLYDTLVDAAAGKAVGAAGTDAITLYNCFKSTSATCAGTRFHYAETFDYDIEATTPDLVEGEAAVGFVVSGSEYSMRVIYSESGNCMTTELYKLTGTSADPHQNTNLNSNPAYFGTCTTVRAKFDTVNAGWMPRTSSGAISWCGPSCTNV